MNKPREAILNNIISSSGIFQHKYTSAFNSIKAVINLEKKEKKTDRIPESYFKSFEQINKNKDNLLGKDKTIPLAVVEQYFLRKSKDLNKEIYINYNNVEIFDFKAIELYQILEDFFAKIYILAVEIADLYSIEIKLNNHSSDDEDILS